MVEKLKVGRLLHLCTYLINYVQQPRRKRQHQQARYPTIFSCLHRAYFPAHTSHAGRKGFCGKGVRRLCEVRLVGAKNMAGNPTKK